MGQLASCDQEDLEKGEDKFLKLQLTLFLFHFVVN